MDWKLYLGIAVGAVLLLGGVIAELERIGRFVRWLVKPVLKKLYLRNASWPMNIELKRVDLYDLPIPAANIEVEFLVKPRKPILTGKCLLLLDNRDAYEPLNNIPNITSYQEWQVRTRLSDPVTFILSFRVVNPKAGDQIQIEIESEGYFCKSNSVTIS